MKRYFFLFFLSFFTLLSASADNKNIIVLTIDGIITPIINQYIEKEITKASTENAHLIIIELNTPGGLLDSTRSIIEKMINSNIPVVVYVTPKGARATSAGVFITMASDIAAMAPETHIGAAHPVSVGETTEREKTKKNSPLKISVNEEKAVSDSVAYIKTLAQNRGRNYIWAEKAVRESVSLTSDEALKQNVIEFISPSLKDLLSQIHGKKLLKNSQTIILDTKNPNIQNHPMTQIKKFLQTIAHPNIAYILMTIGIYGLIYELAAPGIGLGGAIGGISLLLAFFGLQVLPINTVGMALLILGAILFVMEIFIVSHGILIMGGIAAFTAGSLLLIDVQGNLNFPRISLEIIGSFFLTNILFFGILLKKILSAKKQKPKTGIETFIGLTAEVKDAISPHNTGQIFVIGELWAAQSNEHISVGERVKIISREGNQFVVQKIN